MFLRPQSEFPTPLFRLTIAFLIGLSLGMSIVWVYLNPSLTPVANPLNYKHAVKSPALAPSASPLTGPTANWTPYTDTYGKYSLRYNPSWKIKNCDGTPSAVFFGPTTAALGTCNSDDHAQVVISVGAPGDSRTLFEYTPQGYSNLSTSTVTINGYTVEHQTATLSAANAVGPVVGTRLAQYIFVTGGKTYIASYVQAPSGATSSDVMHDFDLMVGTLTFS